MTAVLSLHDATWLTSGPVARVLGILNSDGEEARVVGGAVRNALLGLSVDEIDIATTALPEQVISLCRFWVRAPRSLTRGFSRQHRITEFASTARHRVSGCVAPGFA